MNKVDVLKNQSIMGIVQFQDDMKSPYHMTYELLGILEDFLFTEHDLMKDV